MMVTDGEMLDVGEYDAHTDTLIMDTRHDVIWNGRLITLSVTQLRPPLSKLHIYNYIYYNVEYMYIT